MQSILSRLRSQVFCAVAAASFLLCGFSSFRLTAANGFAVASVKPSGQTLGRDRAPSRLTFGPEGIQGRNVTLKGLILQAYEVLPHQVAAGPEWLDLNEYDIDARSEGRATPKELRIMLQTLLKERFHLTFHRETKQMSVYALVVAKGGPKLHPLKDSSSHGANLPDFRGNLQDLANLIGVQLSIPTLASTPTRQCQMSRRVPLRRCLMQRDSTAFTKSTWT